MALVKPAVFQIVGYKNSGKTTVVTRLITLMENNGIKVATIKHHGHGGKPDMVEDKDSWRHFETGAAASIVEGAGRLLLQAERHSWTLDEKIQLLGFFKTDVILIEGFKKEKYPKILLIRDKEDEDLIKRVSNLRAIIYWDQNLPPQLDKKMEVPLFSINDEDALQWIVNDIQNELKNKDS